MSRHRIRTVETDSAPPRLSPRSRRRRSRGAPSQSALPYLPFSVDDLLAEVRAAHFPRLPHRVDWGFFTFSALGAIVGKEDNTAVIAMHDLLNHPDTPREVIGFVLKHELLHLVVAPVKVEGQTIQHPAEFWEREFEIGPEREAVWTWIWCNFWPCLVHTEESYRVLPQWRKVWGQRRFSIAHCLAMEAQDQPRQGVAPSSVGEPVAVSGSRGPGDGGV